MNTDKIIEHEENKNSVLNNYFNKIKPLHLGILLIFFIGGAVYLGGDYSDNQILIGAGIVIILLYILSRGGVSKQNVNYETAMDLLERFLSNRLNRIKHGLIPGEIVVSPKGYSQIYGEQNYHMINFFIRDYEEGFKHWYVGRISKQDGSFCGCNECPGDISGEPPVDYGSRGGGEGEEDGY